MEKYSIIHNVFVHLQIQEIQFCLTNSQKNSKETIILSWYNKGIKLGYLKTSLMMQLTSKNVFVHMFCMIWLLWKISQYLQYKDSFPINMRQNQCHMKAKLTLIPFWSQEKKMFKGKYLHFYLQKITFFMYLFCLLVFVLLLHRYCIKHLQLSMFEKFLAKVHKFNSLSLTAFLLHLNIFT